MSVTYAAPTSFAETQSSNSGLPAAWLLARQGLLFKLVDALDVVGGPIFDPDVLDLAGAKTDTARWGDVSGVGWEEAMNAAGSEVSAITASTQTTQYSSVALGEYVLAYTDTFKNQILMGGDGNGVALTLDELEMKLPANYGATVRSLVTTQGAAISAITVGSTTLDNSMDDVYDLVAAHRAKYGAGALGTPVLTIRAAQHNKIIESARNENFLFGTALAQQMQRVATGQVLVDPYGVGIDVQLTDDVVSATSVLKGFCVSPGAFKRAIANPAGARVPQGARKMVLAPFGLLVWERLSGSDTRTSGFNALALLGTALKSADVSFQALFRSKA